MPSPRRVNHSSATTRRVIPRSVLRFAPLAGAALQGSQPLVALAQSPEKGGVERSAAGATRSYTLEAVVVVVLMGLALFSVCRTSRRV